MDIYLWQKRIICCVGAIPFWKDGADFQIRGDLSRCSSKIEQSYGMNLPSAGMIKEYFLGRCTRFSVISAEIWVISRDTHDEHMISEVECKVFDISETDRASYLQKQQQYRHQLLL